MSPSITFSPAMEAREELLSKVILRLAGHLRGMGSAESVQVFIGLVPDHVRLEFPMPTPHRVVATSVQSENDFHLFLDVALSPPEVVDFFRSSLPQEGWTEFSRGTPSVGFQPHLEGSIVYALFRHPLKAMQLHVMAWPDTVGEANVTLQVIPFKPPADTSLLAQANMRQEKPMPLPRLIAPAGTWKVGGELGGASGGGSSVGFSHATLQSQLSQQEVLHHFGDQLRTAGWDQIGIKQLDATIVTTWLGKDADGEVTIGGLAIRTTSSPPDMHDLWIFAHRLFERT